MVHDLENIITINSSLALLSFHGATVDKKKFSGFTCDWETFSPSKVGKLER